VLFNGVEKLVLLLRVVVTEFTTFAFSATLIQPLDGVGVDVWLYGVPRLEQLKCN